MLIHNLDMDRAFDLTIKKTLPFLIFPSDNFKLKLSGMLSSLYQYYSERNEIKFEQLNNDIESMIENACLDSNTDITLFNFKYQQMTLDQAQQKLNERTAKINLFVAELEDVKSRISKLEAISKSDPVNISNKERDRNNKKSDKTFGPSNVDIVIECIKKSPVPQSKAEISAATNLQTNQVNTAIDNIKKYRPHLMKNISFGSREHQRKDTSTVKITTIMWIPSS